MTSTKVKQRDSITFSNRSYMNEAFGCIDALITNAETQLYGNQIEFDTMVGIGLSGHLVLPILARHFKVNMFAARKPNVRANALWPAEGTLGKRWILVDDFISTGRTLKVVKGVINNAINEACRTGYGFSTEYAGTYGYTVNRHGTTSFYLPDDMNTRVSKIKIEFDGEDMYLDAYQYTKVKDVMADLKSVDVRNLKTETMIEIRTRHFDIDIDELSILVVAAQRELMLD